MAEYPPLVVQARALARQVGFALTREEAGDGASPSCCLPGVGRILAAHAGRLLASVGRVRCSPAMPGN